MFIAFEGLDACGKGTQQEMLANWFEANGFSVLQTRVPGGTPNAEDIRKLFLFKRNPSFLPLTALHLACAALHEHAENVVKPALKEGKIVLCDRWIFSTFAYQHGGQKLSFHQVATFILPAVDYILPNLTFYLDVDVQTSSVRRTDRGLGADTFEERADEFHKAVRLTFLSLGQFFPNFLILDGSKTKDDIHQQITYDVSNRLIDRSLG